MKHRNRVPMIDGLAIDQAHKGGNPFKSVAKAVKKAVKQTSAEASRAGDVAIKTATSVAAGATDPGTWVGYMAGGTDAAIGLGAAKAQETYQAMNQAERDEADAEAERMRTMTEEQRLQAVAEKTQAMQAKMVKDRDAKAKASAEERATRLGTGRRGLLYQGKETGVSNKSTVLGG